MMNGKGKIDHCLSIPSENLIEVNGSTTNKVRFASILCSTCLTYIKGIAQESESNFEDETKLIAHSSLPAFVSFSKGL